MAVATALLHCTKVHTQCGNGNTAQKSEAHGFLVCTASPHLEKPGVSTFTALAPFRWQVSRKDSTWEMTADPLPDPLGLMVKDDWPFGPLIPPPPGCPCVTMLHELAESEIVLRRPHFPHPFPRDI